MKVEFHGLDGLGGPFYIGTVETSLGQGPIYFNCYPNKTVSLMDINILDSLFLNIHFHSLDMKEGSIPAALILFIGSSIRS